MRFASIRNRMLGLFLVVILMAAQGCTSIYKVDLAEQREANLTKDLARLKPKRPLNLPDPMKLEDVIRVGLANNLDLRISRILAEVADDQALSEKLKMLPRLDLNGELSHRTEHDLKEYKNLDTGETTLGRSISNEKTRKYVSLSLTWNVLDFGLSYIRARQAFLDAEIKRMERLRQAQTIAMEIAAAYWKAVLAEQDLERIKAIQADVEIYRTKAQEMVDQKRIDAIVAKEIEQKLADLAITTANLEADISGAKIELRRLMGLDPMTEFNLAQESFQEYLEKMPRPEELDPRKLEMIALNRRPEFFAADLELSVQQEEARSVLLSMFPGLRFDIAGHYDGNTYLVNNEWATVGARLMVDFLSLPSKYWEWKAEKMSVEMVNAQRLLLTAGVIAQTHLAVHDYAVKEEQFRLHDEAYGISDELLTMSGERYRLGLLSDTVMTQRMVESMVSRIGRDRSLVELLNAYYTLMVTLGIDYEGWDRELMGMDENAMLDNVEYKDILGGLDGIGTTLQPHGIFLPPGEEGPGRADAAMASMAGED